MMLSVILLSKFDHVSDLWQQQQLASELQSHLQDTVDWARKWLADFNAGKTQLVLFDQPDNIGTIDVKMDEFVLEEKPPFKMLGCLSLLNYIQALTLSLLLKLPPRKLDPWFILWTSFILGLLCISKNLRYCLAWNIVLLLGIVW